MATRYDFGPAFAFSLAAAVPPPPPTKSDPALSLIGVTGETLKLQLPAYDTAASNRVVEVRAYLVPAGQAQPADAAGFLASSFPFSVVDLSTLALAGTVSPAAEIDLPLPAVPAGDYAGRVVVGFGS